MGEQVQASGFAENTTRQLAGSISHKKLARPRTLTFLRHQNNNDRHDGKTHNFK
jgi:hypothetical protein